MPHQNGWFNNTQLPPSEFWTDQNIDDENSDKLVMVFSYEARNYNLVENYRFRIMNQVIKNNIKGGHAIKIQLKNENQQ